MMYIEGQPPRVRRPLQVPELLPEFDETDEVCFVRAAAMQATGEKSPEEYFSSILPHLQLGGPRHKFDSNENDGNIPGLMQWSLTSAMVKSLMLRSDFIPLEGDGTHPLNLETWNRLAVHVWSDAVSPDALQRELKSLPDVPWTAFLVALLAVIAYERRHHDLFSALVSPSLGIPPPLRRTVFDRFDYNLFLRRAKDGDGTSRSELRLWTCLLEAPKWLPAELPWALVAGISTLLRPRDNRTNDALNDLDRFFSALQSRGAVPELTSVVAFIADEACTAAQVRCLDARFPLPQLVQNNQHNTSMLAKMTLGVASWETRKAERLDVMRLLLEAGVDPNWTDEAQRHWVLEARARGGLAGGVAPLHRAADRGDKEMVELLLQYKAKSTLADGNGKSPSKRAELAGHREVAAILEAWVPAVEEPDVWEISPL